MIAVDKLRILLEDWVVIDRLWGSRNISPCCSSLPSNAIELLKKSDQELAALLADPSQDLTWLEPHFGYIAGLTKYDPTAQ